MGRPEASAAEQAVGGGQSKHQQHRIHTTAAKQLLDNNSIANSPPLHYGEDSRRCSSVRLRCSRKFYAASPCRASDGNQTIGAGVGGTVGRL
jgi:hypothetical protein